MCLTDWLVVTLKVFCPTLNGEILSVKFTLSTLADSENILLFPLFCWLAEITHWRDACCCCGGCILNR